MQKLMKYGKQHRLNMQKIERKCLSIYSNQVITVVSDMEVSGDSTKDRK